MRNSQIEVRPIAGAIGAEIHSVDVSQDLDERTIGDIRKALLDHCVIFFRDQKLDADRHKAFTRRFGKLFIHPNYKGMQADPEIVADHARARRQEDRRRGVACRHHHGGRAAHGRHPLRHRSAALWRRHAVCQPVSGLRGAVRRHEADARRAQGPALGPQSRRPAGQHERAPLDQSARGCRLARDRQRASGRGDASRDRPQAALRQPLLHVLLRGHDGGGEQAAARLPARARPPARVHLPLPLGDRLDRVLGQPRLQAPGHP